MRSRCQLHPDSDQAMCFWKRLILLVACLACATASCFAAEKKVVLAIISDPALRDEETLLSSALSKQGDFTLVERSQLENLLAERKLQTSGTSGAEYAQALKVLKADGLLLMQSTKVAEKTKITLRLVSVNAGVVLAEEPFEPELFKQPGFEAIIVSRFRQVWSLLTEDLKNKTPISLIGIFAPVDSIEGKAKEREWSTRLAYWLAQEKGLVVLERKNLDALVKEKAFNGTGYHEFLTGRCLIDGQFTESGSTVKIKLRLQFPGVNTTADVEAEGEAGNPSALSEEITTKVLLALKKQPDKGIWDVTAEAKKYQAQATWALDHELYREAQSAGEVAWALGTRSDELAELLLISYAKAAFPAWDPLQHFVTHRGNIESDEYAKFIKVQDEPDRVEFAIREMEILWEHLQKTPRTEQPYNFWDEYEGKYPHHYDFRLMGTKAILNASRVLREFYEENTLSRHEDRLAVLRQLLKENAGILLKSGVTDLRMNRLLNIQVDYAAYWYERPEEVLDLYRAYIKSDPIGNDTFHDSWPALHDGSDNSKGRWLIAWNPKNKPRTDALWKAFLENLHNSNNTENCATFWMFMYNTPEREDNFKLNQIYEFLWEQRAHIANGQLETLPWRILSKALSSFRYDTAHQTYPARYFEYLMKEGSFVRQELLWSLWNVHQMSCKGTEEDRRRFKQMWDEYVLRMKVTYPEIEVRKYLKSRFTGYVNGVLNPSKKESLSDNSHTDYPKPPSDALPVTKFWCTWSTFPEIVMHDSISMPCYQDGKITVFTESRQSFMFEIQLETFKADKMAIPKTTNYNSSLAVNSKLIFFATDNLVYKYDRESKQWKTLDLPPSKYAVTYLSPFFYLSFEDNASGLYRYDPRNENLELLTSTRSRLPVSQLDEERRYQPKEICQSSDGRLCFAVELGDKSHPTKRKIYLSDRQGKNWKLLFETDKNSDGDIIVTNEPKGLLIHVFKSWGFQPYFSYFPDVETAEKLVILNANPERKIPSDYFRWKSPVAHIKNRNFYDAVWHNGFLAALSMRTTQLQGYYTTVHPILHIYLSGKTEAIDIPLDLQIGDEEAADIISKATRNCVNDEVKTAIRLRTLPKFRSVDSLLSVPGGLLICHKRGNCFWFLPDDLLNKRLHL